MSPSCCAWGEGNFLLLHPLQNEAWAAFTPSCTHHSAHSWFNGIIPNSGTRMKSGTDPVCRKVVFTDGDHFGSWWTRTVPTVCSNAVLLTEQALSSFSHISSKSQTDGFVGQLVTQICHIRSSRNFNPAQQSTLFLYEAFFNRPPGSTPNNDRQARQHRGAVIHIHGEELFRKTTCLHLAKNKMHKTAVSSLSPINPMCWVSSVPASSHGQSLSMVFSHFRFVFLLGNEWFRAKADVWLPALLLCFPLSDSDTFFSHWAKWQTEYLWLPIPHQLVQTPSTTLQRNMQISVIQLRRKRI